MSLLFIFEYDLRIHGYFKLSKYLYPSLDTINQTLLLIFRKLQIFLVFTKLYLFTNGFYSFNSNLTLGNNSKYCKHCECKLRKFEISETFKLSNEILRCIKIPC